MESGTYFPFQIREMLEFVMMFLKPLPHIWLSCLEIQWFFHRNICDDEKLIQ